MDDTYPKYRLEKDNETFVGIVSFGADATRQYEEWHVLFKIQIPQGAIS